MLRNSKSWPWKLPLHMGWEWSWFIVSNQALPKGATERCLPCSCLWVASYWLCLGSSRVFVELITSPFVAFPGGSITSWYSFWTGHPFIVTHLMSNVFILDEKFFKCFIKVENKWSISHAGDFGMKNLFFVTKNPGPILPVTSCSGDKMAALCLIPGSAAGFCEFR